jgi:sulfite reductase (NADPH) flavoprotein alpha-component
MSLDLVPNSAPFSTEQRAWLNGFFAGMLGVLDEQIARGGSSEALAAAASLLTPPPGAASSIKPEAEAEEEFPWHDSSLPIVDRMKLADGRPIERRMMAAMAQLDCGSCGYLCKTYAEALANGSEKNLTLCSPGGGETAKMLRQLAKSGNTTKSQPANTSNAVVEKPGTRQNPVSARWLQSRPLNAPGSAKDTRHVEIDLTETGLTYRVGDALGVWPTNCEGLVEQVLSAAGLDGSATDSPSNHLTLFQVLKERCLRAIPSDLVERSVQRVQQRPKHNGAVAADAKVIEDLTAFLESDELDELDVLEFLERFPKLGLQAEDLVETLQPIRPRLYSIASSQSVHPSQVHLTIGRVENEVRGRSRKGVASTMFAERLQPDECLKVFIQPSHGFTIPADPSAPMIMVGPGTGIAPFMAFLQQRAHDQAPGKNWLFFGDQREDFDFLYREALENWKSTGLLTRLDLAFSRDGKEKLYVQHRMRANGAELFRWLEEGGHFYVCGDASRMAVDVDQALQDIVAEHGQLSANEAKQYLAELAKNHRYVRDVY